MQTIYKRLKEIKLSGMAHALEERISYANLKKLSYQELLKLLCEDEFDNRRDNNYKRRYSAAKLLSHKKLEDFDFIFHQCLDEKHINDVATCKFIQDQHNII